MTICKINALFLKQELLAIKDFTALIKANINKQFPKAALHNIELMLKRVDALENAIDKHTERPQ